MVPGGETALAEAEVEYHDHVSPTIWVKFPVTRGPDAAMARALVVIYSTTPWTIPANRAVAAGASFDYAVIRVDDVAAASMARVGEKLVVAEALLASVLKDTGITAHKVLQVLKGAELAGHHHGAPAAWSRL